MAPLVGSSRNNSHNFRRSRRNHSCVAKRAATVVVSASSGVVAVVVAAADETSHAEARLAKPSQASQSREGLTNGIGYIVVIRHKARPITRPPISDKSNDLIHGQQEGGI